jgi:hypothetical protein
MALKVPKGGGPDLFKAGYKYMSGLEEAVLRNIQAVGELTEIVRTSFGPNGEFSPCYYLTVVLTVYRKEQIDHQSPWSTFRYFRCCYHYSRD